MNELNVLIKQYLDMSTKEGEDAAFEWLTTVHPKRVTEVLNYMEEFSYMIHEQYYRG